MNRKYGLKSFPFPIAFDVAFGQTARIRRRERRDSREDDHAADNDRFDRPSRSPSATNPLKCLLSSFRGVPWHVRHARTRSLLFLPTVVDALVVVQAVESPEHLVAQRADRAVQGLKVLLLFVPFQGELRREGLAAHVARVTDSWWQ